MYAIIETGSKQYRVEQGDIIDVELLAEDKPGSAVKFSQVLFLNDGSKQVVGAPYIEKCVVHGEYVDESKGPKVVYYHYKRRKNFRRKVGHRQKYAKVKITKIQAN